MENGVLSVAVRRMAMEDIDYVLKLDRMSFATPWSANTYQHEVRNSHSTMLVVEPYSFPASTSNHNPIKWLRRLLSPAIQNTARYPLLAYSGFWLISGEAHISTIAVHPDFRGHKLGELLIWCMAMQAIRLEAEVITLEVRISNDIAQSLYRKYGFEVSGRRKGYYRDNGEDAYLMTAANLDSRYKRMLIDYGHQLEKRLSVKLKGLHTLPEPV